MKFILLALLLIAALGAAGRAAADLPRTPAQGAPPDARALVAEDADFLAAREAFRTGDAARLDRVAGRLKNSLLEPYVAYYRLRMRLEAADIATIQAFLARSDETPVIDRLRGEWLKLLGKKRQWEAFAGEYPRLLGEDAELICYALQARLHMRDGEALREARELWLAGDDELPESCAPLFDAAIVGGIISETDIRSRVRLVLEAGNATLAGQLSGKLPAKRALPAAALSGAKANPERYLKNIRLKNAGEAQRAVALFALQRLAKQLPQLAFAQWKKIADHFSADEQRYFYSWLAYEAARRHDERALEWFRAAGDAPLTRQQRAWRTRAALRAPDWREVRASIEAMPQQQQQQAAWRYWGARALKELGQAEEAEKQFALLSGEYNFYGQLAAEEVTAISAADTVSAGYQPGKEELDTMLARPAIQRALALYRMDLRTDAAREWAWAERKFDDRQLLAAAEIARRNEIYDLAINSADLTVQLHDFNLRYLAPYRDELRGHIRQLGLEEAWVYGLMRQESRFVKQAKSEAGASGLMQIMPATARWLARKLGMKNYRRAMVRKLDTNLAMGTYYMKTVLEWLDNSPVLASAAYNAGPSRARQWRGDRPLEGAVYAETIPFDETRGYVKKVMSNTVHYSRLFGQPPRSLKERMGVIAARDANNRQAVPDEK
ncbi:MAG: lytic transglycosylase domain-containing protein [Nitrosomonadales bacterium]|nr:lytic transglycosylase domain-containing protein [Nitrosomonadales bacterium]